MRPWWLHLRRRASGRADERCIARRKGRAPEPTGSGAHLVAGVRYEAEQTNRRTGLLIVELTFEARGTTLVPVAAAV